MHQISIETASVGAHASWGNADIDRQTGAKALYSNNPS